MASRKILSLSLAPVLAGLLLLPATSLLAQDDEKEGLCGITDVGPDHFVGAYTMDVGPGYVTDGEMTMTAVGPNLVIAEGITIPSPASVFDQLEVKMFSMNGELALEARGNVIGAEIIGPDEPNWSWPSELGAPQISSEDMEVMVGCPNEQLPRLIAEGTATSADGQPLDVTIRLVQFYPTTLGGTLKWAGGGFRSTRWVTLNKR